MAFFPIPNAPAIAMAEVQVFAEGLDHPEGLAFDADGILWAGGEAGQIYSIAPDGVVAQVGSTGGFCLGITISRQQEIHVCDVGRHAVVRMDRSGKILSAMESAAGEKLRNPNFILFDQEDSLYFSDSGSWANADGAIFRVRKNGASEKFAGPLAFPNGMALSAGGAYLYVVESTRDRVLRIPILADGRAGDAEVYAAGLERVPDGAALDAAGNLYVTCYATDCVYRIAPGGAPALLLFDPEGTQLASPTNIAFGGEDLNDMYIANLSRWHISKVKMETPGLALAGQKFTGQAQEGNPQS